MTPFLSVVVPIAGAGTQALRESLLCLVGQDETDFEVVLVAGASTSPEKRVEIDELVADQPRRLASRLRLVECPSATPGAVRNAGLSAARGRYVTVLPEGDLAFGRWVRAFHLAEQASDGRVLRGIGVTQEHSVVAVDGHEAVRAEASPRSSSPARFSLWQHALEPRSPAASWAWPRALVQDHGIQYDATVVDDPDWELLVRVAELVGVHDLGIVTCLHRTWDPTRPPARRAAEGPAAHEVIDGRPLLLPAGESGMLRAGLAEDAARRSLLDDLSRTSEELRLTHDHAANLEAMVRSLEARLETGERRHAKEVARLRRTLDKPADGPSSDRPAPATERPGRSWRPRRRGSDAGD